MTPAVHVLLKLTSCDPDRLKAAVEYLLQDGGGNRGNRINGDNYVGIGPLNHSDIYDRILVEQWLDLGNGSQTYLIFGENRGETPPHIVFRE